MFWKQEDWRIALSLQETTSQLLTVQIWSHFQLFKSRDYIAPEEKADYLVKKKT